MLAQRDADAAYQAALVTEQAEVALLEGPGMREEIQGKVCSHPNMTYNLYTKSSAFRATMALPVNLIEEHCRVGRAAP